MIKYSSGLVSESFWFMEFKKMLIFKSRGKSWDEIKDLCINENLLGISIANRARRTYGYLKTRIDVLDEELINIFFKTDLSTQKVINIISIAKKNRLFFEFLYEVYREKILIGDLELDDRDVNIFFKNKQDQNKQIGRWKEVTLNRLRSVYINFLIEAELIIVVNNKREITPPILDDSLENYLKLNGDTQLLKAIKGVN